MYKSPAAPSNLIHIMKSLWRLKSKGPLAYQKQTQTYSAIQDLLRAPSPLERLRVQWFAGQRFEFLPLAANRNQNQAARE